MRFLSKYGGLTVPAISAEEQPMPNGRLAVIDPGVMCEFQQLHITEYEYELALREFKFNGQPMELDNKTDVSPRFRIGVYDTDKEAREKSWNAETKAIVERALLEIAQNDNREAVMHAAIGANIDDAGHVSQWAAEVATHQQSFEKVLVYVEPQQIPKPWNTYDEIVTGRGISKEDVAAKIARIVADIGADPEAVIAYEQANRDRLDVITKLESLLPAPAGPDPDEIVVQTIS